MSITSHDIAKLAGVSRGTVDRVINNRPGVKKETRERVEKIIQELDYVPSRAGKALSTAKRPVTVEIVINRGENEFYDDVIQGMESCKEDYSDFTLSYSYQFLKHYDVKEQVTALKKALEKMPNLLILTPINHPKVVNILQEITNAGIPVITVNSDIHGTDRLLHVGCDFFASGQTAAGMLLLIAKEPLTVGIVTGSEQMLGHKQRVTGFLSTLEDASSPFQHAITVESYDQEEHAYQQVREMLEQHPTINAVYFAASGVKGGIKAIEESKKDLLIITCDDFPFIRQQVLTGVVQATVCQEPFRQGHEAVHQGLQYLISGQIPVKSTIYMKNEIKIAENIK